MTFDNHGHRLALALVIVFVVLRYVPVFPPVRQRGTAHSIPTEQHAHPRPALNSRICVLVLPFIPFLPKKQIYLPFVFVLNVWFSLLPVPSFFRRYMIAATRNYCMFRSWSLQAAGR